MPWRAYRDTELCSCFLGLDSNQRQITELSWTYHLLMRTGSCSLAIVLNLRTNTSNILISSSRPCPFSSSLRALMHSTRLSSSLQDMVWILQHIISLTVPHRSIHCPQHPFLKQCSTQLQNQVSYPYKPNNKIQFYII